MAMSKGKLFLIIAIVVIIVVGGVAAGLLLSKIIKLPQATQTAKISYVEGTVEFRDGDNVWKDAEKDQKLNQGASVKTSDGLAVVDLDDGSQIRLNTKSQVTLTTLESKHYVVTNDQGDVYSRVAKSKDRTFEVKVVDTTYQAQGTAFRTFNIDSKKGVEVYESKVTILGVDKNNKILVEQGKKYYLVFKDDKSKEMKVIEIDKNDLKKDEFAIWNKQQDELVREFKDNLGLLFDINPPNLEITSPIGDIIEGTESVLVAGFAEAGAKVMINGQQVTVDKDGRFSQEIKLAGLTSIKIEAVDASGNMAFKNIYIKKKKDTPVATKTVSPTVSGTPGTMTKTPTSKPTDTPKPGEPTSTSAPQAGISLAGSVSLCGAMLQSVCVKGINLNWTYENLGNPIDFKLVYSTSSNPSYPANSWLYHGAGDSYFMEVSDGVTYHFRVCRLNGSSCDIYSNDVSVTAPSTPPTNTPVPPTDTPSPVPTTVTPS